SVSGVAEKGACQYFGGTCYTNGDCCPGLYCAETNVCAFSINADGGSGSSGGSSASGAGSSSSSASSSSSSSLSSGSSSGSSSSSSSSGSAFSVAAHSEANVPDNGGPVIAAPVLVSITYSDDSNRATEEAFDAFIVTSNWLATVGPEYRIGAGT